MKKTHAQREELYGKVIVISLLIIVFSVSIFIGFAVALAPLTVQRSISDTDNGAVSNMADLGNNLFCGKNLLNIGRGSQSLSTGVKATYNSPNIVLNGTKNGASKVSLFYPYINFTGKYTISVNVVSGRSTQYFILEFCEGDRVLGEYTYYAGNTGGKQFVLTNPNITVVKLYVYEQGVVFNNLTLSIQIEEGNVATAHEPYIDNKQTSIFHEPIKYEPFIDGLWGQHRFIGGIILPKHQYIDINVDKRLFLNLDLVWYKVFIEPIGLADDDFTTRPLYYDDLSPDKDFSHLKFFTGRYEWNVVLQLFHCSVNELPATTATYFTAQKLLFPYDSIEAEADYNNGYKEGHNVGYNKGSSTSTTAWNNLFPSIFGGIADFFKNLLSFEVFGKSLLSIIGTVGAVVIAMVLIKLVVR